jgi:hypothetical protein
MLAGLALAYLRILRFGWNVRTSALVGVLLCASMLTGTKGAAAGALGVTCAYFYGRHRAFSASVRAATVVAVLVAAATVAYFALPAIQRAADLSLRYFAHQSGRTSENRLLTMLLSGRNLKLANVWDGLADQNYVALLTGGYPVTRYMVEIDIPDLLLTMGLPVFAAYAVAFRAAFVHSGRRDVFARYGKLLFLVLVAVAATAGHLLDSAVIGPYLAMVAVVLKRGAAPYLNGAPAP